MKICGICKQEKPYSDFYTSRRTGRYFPDCKSCRKARNKRDYGLNPIPKRVQSLERLRQKVEIAREYIINYLSDHPCVDCGESDIVVLEFDHVRDEKETSVSYLIRAGKSIALLQEEISKCDVRCANCHRRKTAKDQAWYKLLQDVSSAGTEFPEEVHGIPLTLV